MHRSQILLEPAEHAELAASRVGNNAVGPIWCGRRLRLQLEERRKRYSGRGGRGIAARLPGRSRTVRLDGLDAEDVHA